MYIFNSDLDNTLIFSNKHDIGTNKVNVEIYEGRESGFATERTLTMLKELVDKVIFVPTTTRTEEQYNRIDLGIGVPRYALVCNGGVLLCDGVRDESWYNDSLNLALPAKVEMDIAQEFLHEDSRREFELRYIDGLFLYTKCSEPNKVIEDLRKILDLEKVSVLNNGNKLYVLPHGLSKGKAVLRLKERIENEGVIAAGDSEFDVSMLEAADFAIGHSRMKEKLKLSNKISLSTGRRIFSEEALDFVFRIAMG